MPLFRYTYEYADGSRETNVLSAGNAEAAEKRGRRHADARGAMLVEVTAYVPDPGGD